MQIYRLLASRVLASILRAAPTESLEDPAQLSSGRGSLSNVLQKVRLPLREKFLSRGKCIHKNTPK